MLGECWSVGLPDRQFACLLHGVRAKIYTVDLLTLLFSVLAAFAGSLASYWMWKDRPRRAWRMTIQRSMIGTISHGNVSKFFAGDLEDAHKARVTLQATGTDIMHQVSVRTHNADFIYPDEETFADRLVPGGKPLEFELYIRDAEAGAAYIEILWHRTWPLTIAGERMDLRTRQLWDWKWKWTSVRWIKNPGQRFWKGRWARTKGKWVERYKPPRVPIPEGAGE